MATIDSALGSETFQGVVPRISIFHFYSLVGKIYGERKRERARAGGGKTPQHVATITSASGPEIFQGVVPRISIFHFYSLVGKIHGERKRERERAGGGRTPQHVATITSASGSEIFQGVVPQISIFHF